MLTGANRVSVLRFVAGLALGWATSWAILRGGFALLQVVWPDYALVDLPGFRGQVTAFEPRTLLAF
jgi:hypothetical protein